MTKLGGTGHQHLSPESIEFISARLADAFKSAACKGELQGITSLAIGADRLFARGILEVQGDLHVVVPCHRYEETFRTSCDVLSYKEFLSRATEVEQLDFDEPSEEAFMAAGRRIVDRCDELIAIWDGQPARGLGGTADIVTYARQARKPVAVIWPDGVRRT